MYIVEIRCRKTSLQKGASTWRHKWGYFSRGWWTLIVLAPYTALLSTYLKEVQALRLWS